MTWVIFFVILFCLFWLNPNLYGLILCTALAVVFYFTRPVIMRIIWRIGLHREVTPEIVSFLSKELRSYPLHYAVFCNDFETADRLLDEGYTVAHETADGQTPLHVAAECNQPGMCRFLLENGAEIGAPGGFGGSPLHAAAACQSQTRVIKLLLKYGANPLQRDCEGLTPLEVAQKYEHPQIVYYLRSLPHAREDSEN